MNSKTPDLELEYELEELYILCKHWVQDISFVEDETRFFKNIAKKYSDTNNQGGDLSMVQLFKQKTIRQEANIAALKEGIAKYLKSLEPYISDLNKAMSIDLIEEFAGLQTEVQALFDEFRNMRKELFDFAEKVIKEGTQIHE
jgi:hypothetical protein